MPIEVKANIRKPNHPGKILKEVYMKPLNISVFSMSKRLHIPRKNLSKIINCQNAVTLEISHKLAKTLNTTPQLWLNLQSNYDIFHMERNGTT